MIDRDCANCKHHTSDGCSSWDCEFETKDLISRADAIEEISKGVWNVHELIDRINALPSADATVGDYPNDVISRNALMEYCSNQKNKTIDNNDIARFPSAETVSREFYEDAVKANIRIVMENSKLKEQIESAEAVEVVRCRDCKHKYVSGNGTTQYYVCDFMDAQYEDDGFCHHGERREE